MDENWFSKTPDGIVDVNSDFTHDGTAGADQFVANDFTAVFESAIEQLEQPPLSTGERTFEIDRLQSICPIFDRCTVRPGGLLVRTQDRLTGVRRVKLQPRLSGSVTSLLAANPDDVGSRGRRDLRVACETPGIIAHKSLADFIDSNECQAALTALETTALLPTVFSTLETMMSANMGVALSGQDVFDEKIPNDANDGRIFGVVESTARPLANYRLSFGLSQPHLFN